MDGGLMGGLVSANPAYNKFDYQPKFIDDIREYMKLGYRRVAGESPTGSGKSFVVLELARSVLGKGGQFRYIGPRKQLVQDIGDKADKAGIPYSMHMSGIERPVGQLPNVQLWCIKSFLNYLNACQPIRCAESLQDGDMMPEVKLKHVDLFAVDEAHINQTSILKLVQAYPKSRFIFLTATPLPGMDRFFIDGKPVLVNGPTVKELTRRGVLVPARYKTFEPDNLEAEYLRGEIVSTWIREGENRPTVVFCKNRKEAKHIQQRFLFHGVPAEYMDALTKGEERKEIFDRIERGESKVLVNVKVMEYGVDKPFFSCAVLAYAVEAKLEDTLTKLAGYIQRAGRVLRAAPGKTDALIICLTGIVNMFRALDEEREWEIDGKKIKDMAERERREVEKERDEADSSTLITCHECGHNFVQLSHCPRCNAAVSSQGSEDVQHIDSRIAEINLETGRHRSKPGKMTPLWTKETAHTAFENILWCVRSKKKKDGSSYSDGMAFHIYEKLHTGIKPPFSKTAKPKEPDAVMKDWYMQAIRNHNAAFWVRQKYAEKKRSAA